MKKTRKFCSEQEEKGVSLLPSDAGRKKQPKSLVAFLSKNLVLIEKVEVDLVKRTLKPRASEGTVRKGHHHFKMLIAMPCWWHEWSGHLTVGFGNVNL